MQNRQFVDMTAKLQHIIHYKYFSSSLVQIVVMVEFLLSANCNFERVFSAIFIK